MTNWTMLLLVFFMMYTLVALSIGLNCSISSLEYHALNDLYNQTGGDRWRWGTPDNLVPISERWRFPSPLTAPCSKWDGITCKAIHSGSCVIISVERVFSQLVGNIPQSFSTLSSLTLVNFRGNRLKGTFPESIVSITSLEMVDVSQNFYINIPDNIGQLSNLIVFNISANMATGSIPESISQLIKLKELYLGFNYIGGPFPSVLLKLSNLEVLAVSSNQFTGIVPSGISSLSNLTQLLLMGNRFVGPIPSFFGTMTNLVSLNLQANDFTSSIPSELGNLINLNHLELYQNNLVGVIPRSFTNLVQLRVFSVGDNMIGGPFPNEMFAFENITALSFNLNFITGSLPTEYSPTLRQIDVSVNLLEGKINEAIGTIDELEQFVAFSNSLDGPIPSLLGKLPNLRRLYLNSNSLTGRIPSFRSDSSLEELPLYDNLFSGPIPPDLFELTKLNQIILSSNLLSGSLPTQSANTELFLLDISNNRITSTLPSSMYGFHHIIEALWGYNYLEGSISSNISESRILEKLTLSSNLFSSSIPSEIFELLHMRYLYLDNNVFSGCIPDTLWNHENILTLNLSSNYLKCNIDRPAFINYSISPVEPITRKDRHPLNMSLLFLDISQNMFSGTIPDFVFTDILKLQQLSMSANCFHGIVPPSICLSQQISTLLLDDLGAGDKCTRNIFDQKFNVYPPMAGSIPDCIWNMTTLNTLHLSGNGLTGSLREIEALYDLEDLSMSSNRLTGTIPYSIQTHRIYTHLVLSNNKLTGTLTEDFAVNGNFSKLNLSTNRLSGDIPASLSDLPSIDILSGNLFQCNQPPANDESSNKYICGSQNFDESGRFYGFVFAAVLLIILFCRKYLLRLTVYWDKFIKLKIDLQAITSYMEAVKAALYLCIVCLVSLLFFSVLKFEDQDRLQFSTHSYQYGWLLTVAFVHGSLPSVYVVLVLCLSLFILIVNVFQSKNFFKELCNRVKICENMHLKDSLISFSLQFCNISVITLFNIFYIYLVVQRYPSKTLLVTQICLAMFKVLWSLTYIPWMISVISSSMSRLWALRHELFANLFNFLICPVLVCMFTDGDCLYYSIEGFPQVQASYVGRIEICEAQTITTRRVVLVQLVCHFQKSQIVQSFVSPWEYSYQCGSTILSNYAPIILYSYLLYGLIFPLIQLLCLFASDKYLLKSVPSSCYRDSDWLFFFLNDIDLKDQDYLVDEFCAENTVDSVVEMGKTPFDISGDSLVNDPREYGVQSSFVLSPFAEGTESNVDTNKDVDEVYTASTTASASIMKSKAAKLIVNISPLMRTEWLVSVNLQHLVLLCTFGFGCPLVGLTIAFALIVGLIVLQLQIGRYLQTMESYSRSAFGIFRLCVSFNKNYNKLIKKCLTMVAVTITLFWDLFIFDMVADVYGGVLGGVAVIVTNFGVLVISWVAFKYDILLQSLSFGNSIFRSSSDRNVELSAF